MGAYWNFKGTVTFKDQESFDAFLKIMIEKDWYAPENDAWVTDDGRERRHEGDEDTHYVNYDTLTITLPDTLINNFYVLMDALPKNKWTGVVRGASDDGGLSGCEYFPDGKYESYDLEEWAKEHGFSLEWDEENEDYLTEDRWDVIDGFLENPNPPKNSKKFIVSADNA